MGNEPHALAWLGAHRSFFDPPPPISSLRHPDLYGNYIEPIS